jgi:hypothetical protein
MENFKYENDKLYMYHKRNKKWNCCSDNKIDVKARYIRVRVNNKRIPLHRLVYKYHNPNWNIDDVSTNNIIDHIDRNVLNNSISNLRLVNVLQNNNNKIGVRGWVYEPKCKNNPYISVIYHNKKKIVLGYYKTPEEAHNKYLEAKNMFN